MKLTYIILIVFFFIGISELKACEYVEPESSIDYIYGMTGVK